MTDPVNHRLDCQGPRITTARRPDGSTIVRCRRCKSSESVQPGSTQLRAVTALVGQWRCREHLDIPVTWRGKGCRQCDPQPIPSN